MSQASETAGVTIGAAAAQLGVAPETLRSWGRRYGLLPSSATAGGHRRYTPADLYRLKRMQRLVSGGATPARAAAAVLAEANGAAGTAAGTAADGAADGATTGLDEADLAPASESTPRRPGGPGGRVLAVPNGSPEARGLARMASRLDADGVADSLRRLLVERGAVATWQEVLRPVLVAAGARWARTGEGIEIEHLLSEVAIDELRAHRGRQPLPPPARPVLLACFPDDLHALPLYVLSAALAEVRVVHRVLGARVPLEALGAAARRTGAHTVFIWRQMAEPATATNTRGVEVLAALPRTRPAIRVVVGGAGWLRAGVPDGARLALTLPDAVAMLRAAPR